MRFEDLEVWKRAARLSASIYKELRGLRDYGFRDQLTRSGLSVPSNIAEGKAYEFLRLKKGSFPVAEKCVREIISLPMYPELTEEQIRYVVEKITEATSVECKDRNISL